MLTTALLGIAASITTELVTWLNVKLSGTLFRGNAALLLSVLFAFIGGFVRIMLIGVPLENFFDWTQFISIATTVFGFSQLYFFTIAKWFGLTTTNASIPTDPLF